MSTSIVGKRLIAVAAPYCESAWQETQRKMPLCMLARDRPAALLYLLQRTLKLQT